MNQKQALDTLKLGVNVFLTGAAGSGKTYVLNEYIKYLKKNGVNVAITASTGIAATHMNGKTIHSWAHIGIKDALTEADLNKIYSRTDFRMQMMAAQVLIIDEISMLHDYRLDIVDRVLRKIHQNELPFGGIQVVLCGDLFQLPPVTRFGQEVRFVNESEVWNNMNLYICYLDEQYRQNDESFLKILNEIRADSVSQQSLELLAARMNKKDIDKDATRLFTHNVDVDSINMLELDKLKGKTHIFQMISKGDAYVAKSLSDNCLAPAELKLKEGAVVMFVQNNYKKGYVNGTIGRVIKFEKETGNPIVKTTNGKKIIVGGASWRLEEGDYVVAEINQIPLRLAWAITVHKSQGMTLDYAEVDLSKSFTGGMGYVALSRVKSLDNLSIIGINNNSLKISPKIIEFDKQFRNQTKETLVMISKHSEYELKKLHKEFIYATA
jgi:ATP-dependent exoDNAse (exonuclease V) alpha subunit